MSTSVFNPLTGKNSTGNRFCFRVHALGHRVLHLPIAMRRHPDIQKLMEGLSPLVVFNCHSIEDARKKFFRLRMKFDFPYWAALNFKVRDISSGKVVPFILNHHQRWLSERFSDSLFPNPSRKFLVTKTSSRCGLTTFIQAFIAWKQASFTQNSITYTASSSMKDILMGNIRQSFPVRDNPHGFVFYDSDANALFLNAYAPETFDDVPCAFIHLSDMSEWSDHTGDRSSKIISGAMKAWYKTPSSCIILEGNRTLHPEFNIQDHDNPYIPQTTRLMNISDFCHNAYFMNEVVKTESPKLFSDFLHINLDHALL